MQINYEYPAQDNGHTEQLRLPQNNSENDKVGQCHEEGLRRMHSASHANIKWSKMRQVKVYIN